MPEVQCAVKRKEKKAQKEKDKPNSTTNGSPEIIKLEPEVNIFTGSILFGKPIHLLFTFILLILYFFPIL